MHLHWTQFNISEKWRNNEVVWLRKQKKKRQHKFKLWERIKASENSWVMHPSLGASTVFGLCHSTDNSVNNSAIWSFTNSWPKSWWSVTLKGIPKLLNWHLLNSLCFMHNKVGLCYIAVHFCSLLHVFYSVLCPD